MPVCSFQSKDDGKVRRLHLLRELPLQLPAPNEIAVFAPSRNPDLGQTISASLILEDKLPPWIGEVIDAVLFFANPQEHGVLPVEIAKPEFEMKIRILD